MTTAGQLINRVNYIRILAINLLNNERPQLYKSDKGLTTDDYKKGPDDRIEIWELFNFILHTMPSARFPLYIYYCPENGVLELTKENFYKLGDLEMDQDELEDDYLMDPKIHGPGFYVFTD